MQYLGTISKMTDWSLFIFMANHSTSQFCWRRWSWTILWRPTGPSRTNTHQKKDVLFIIGDWNAKVGSQQILRVANRFGLGVQNEARQRLTQFCLLYKHHLSTTQEMTLHMDMIRWWRLKSDWLYSLQLKMDKLYTVSKNKIWSWLWLRSWTLCCQIQT